MSRMYWDAARTRSSLVRWYWCRPGAKPIPGGHVFSSEIWDAVHWWNPGAGEDFASTQTYDKGGPPHLWFAGKFACGSEAYWQGEIPSDYEPLPVGPNGVPICCQRNDVLYLSSVGLGLGGESATVPPPPLNRGGLALGGVSAVESLLVRSAGGLHLGATSVVNPFPKASSGGLRLGATSTYALTSLAVQGGLQIGATSALAEKLAGQGGLQIGGKSALAKKLAGQGGLQLGGKSALAVQRGTYGGLQLGGKSSASVAAASSAGLQLGATSARKLEPFFLDNFNGTSGTGISSHTPDLPVGSNAWVEQSGSWALDGLGNVKDSTLASADIITYDIGKAVGTLTYTFAFQSQSGSTSAPQANAVWRFTDSSNYFLIQCVGQDSLLTGNLFQILKNVSGTFSVLATTSFTFTSGTVYTVTAQVDASGHWTAKINGASTITATDNTFPTITKVGLWTTAPISAEVSLFGSISVKD